MDRKLKIALFGGTFDPPHNAHLELARLVRKKLYLDMIYFIPTAQHPLKANQSITPVNVRIEMLSAALHNQKYMRLSRIEVEKKNTSYTVDMIREFRTYEGLETADLYFILGMDNLHEIHLWKEPQMLFDLVRVVVMKRPGYTILPEYADKVIQADLPLIDISSTEIRSRIKSGKPVTGMLPPGVMEVIEKYRLYH